MPTPPPPPRICGPIVPSLRTKVENKNMHPPKKNCVVCIPFSFLFPISLFTISELLHAALSRLHFHGCPLHLANVHTLQPISSRNSIRCSRRPSILQTIYTKKNSTILPPPPPSVLTSNRAVGATFNCFCGSFISDGLLGGREWGQHPQPSRSARRFNH